MTARIKIVANDENWMLWMAKQDYAIVTEAELVERPHWFEDVKTGRLFHDLYGCLGWPSEVKEGDPGMPGYVAIVGVIRPDDKLEHYNPVDAKFLLLEEYETIDVPDLIDACVSMRERWGFGVHQDLLTMWYGDPERFLTTLSRKNEWLAKAGGPEKAVILTPPDDFYVPKIFDYYVRSMQSVLKKRGENHEPRFYFGEQKILKSKIQAFTRDDPAILAAGGLVHSLLSRTLWLDEMGKAAFNVGM